MERVGGWPVQHLRYKRPGVLTVVAAAGREADVKNKKKNHLSRFSNFFFFFFPFGRQTREGRICIQSVTEPTFQQSQAPHVLSFKKGKENRHKTTTIIVIRMVAPPWMVFFVSSTLFSLHTSASKMSGMSSHLSNI